MTTLLEQAFSEAVKLPDGAAPFAASLVFGDRLLTAADLAALPDELPSGPVHYELHGGRLRIMPLPELRHGRVQATIGTQLMVQSEQRGHGEATLRVGVLLARNPDTVYGPDAAFVSKARFPVREMPEGYLETIPDLVVEVRSKNDTQAELTRKAEDYLRAGARIVWIVDEAARSVTVRVPDSEPVRLTDGDMLRLPEIIPGFEFPVTEVFNPPRA